VPQLLVDLTEVVDVEEQAVHSLTLTSSVFDHRQSQPL
jgi:hypothetical protein